MKHRCRYKIIGTAKIGDFIQCDLICRKCGKVGTVYAYDDYEKQIYSRVAKGKYFNIPYKCVLNEKQFIEFSKIK